jgi:DNA-binding LytR/AlgR family response regulator
VQGDVHASDAGTLRVLILDDEPSARRLLAELVERSGLGHVGAALASADEARVALDSGSGMAFDLVFVDVNLRARKGDRSGLELVRELSKQGNGPVVVLATAYPQHALEAFDLGVADYLRKPFTDERVRLCLERVRDRRPTRAAVDRPSRIAARSARALVFIGTDDVWAFEADDRLVYVHCPEGRFAFDLPLSWCESRLGHQVLRVHRNWVVAVRHVRRLERLGGETLLVVGSPAPPGVRVPVARDRVGPVRAALLSETSGARRV